MSISESENKKKFVSPGRPKGFPKSGGRAKGVLNKKTYWLKDQLEQIDFSWVIEFKKTMDADNYEKAKILLELLPYLNPKIEAKKIDDELNNDDLTVNVNLKSMFDEQA